MSEQLGRGQEASRGATAAPGAAPPQEIGAGFALSNPALVSLPELEKQLRSTWAHEAVSQYPAYHPKVNVALLAMPEIATAQGMADFRHGIDADITEAEARRRETVDQEAAERIADARQQPVRPDAVLSPDFDLRPADSFANKARRAIHDITGGDLFNPPSALSNDPNAPVVNMQREAIRRGILPAGTRMDGRWTPQTNQAYWDLNNEELSATLKGEDRISAISSKSILETFDEWASPTSLLSSAYATLTADIVPNLGEIARETSGWWGKIKKAVDDPFSVKNLVGALGPIDDIVFPMMNAAMLYSGYGSIVGFSRLALATRAAGVAAGARTGTTGLSAAKAAAMRTGAFPGIQKVSRVPKNAGRFVDDLAKAQNPSLIGGALGRASTKTAKASAIPGKQAAAQGLRSGAGSLSAYNQKWRELAAVNIAKKTVGEGMKVGFAAQLEAAISPDRKVGLNPFGTLEQTQAQRLQEYREWRHSNPLMMGASMAFEVAFTPASLFAQGRVSDPFKTRWNSVTEYLSSSPIVKELRPEDMDEFARLESFGRTGSSTGVRSDLEMADSTGKLTAMLHGRVTSMAKDGLLPRRLAKKMREADNPLDQIALVFSGVGKNRSLDDTAAALKAGGAARGEILADMQNRALYMLVETGKEDIATRQAATVFNQVSNPKEFNRLRLALKNQMEAQMVDLGDISETFDGSNYDHLRAYISHRSKAGKPGFKFTASDGVLTDLDADELAELRILQKDLDEMKANYMANPERFAEKAKAELQWHQEMRTSRVNDILDHVDESLVARALSEQFDTFENWDDWIQGVDDFEWHIANNEVNLVDVVPENGGWHEDIISLTHSEYLPESQVNTGVLDRVGRMVDSGNYAVTPQKYTTPTSQEGIRLASDIRQMTRAQRQLSSLAGDEAKLGDTIQSLEKWASTQRPPTTIDKLSAGSIERWSKVRGHSVKAIAAEQEAQLKAAHGLQFLQRNGYDLQNGIGELDRRIEVLNGADFWKKFKVRRTTGAQIEGRAGKFDFVDRETDIFEKLNELEDIAPMWGTEVDIPGSGNYRAVLGDQFFQMSDLRGSVAPLGEMKARTIRKMSLGTFLSRAEDKTVNGLRQVAFRQKLSGLTREFFDYDEATKAWVPKQVKSFDAEGNTVIKSAWDGPKDFDPTPGSLDMQELEKNLNGIHSVHAQALEGLMEGHRGVLGQAGLNIANNAKSFNKYEIHPASLDRWLGTEAFKIPEELRWGPTSLKSVKAAMLQSRSIGWEYRGLAQVGDRIASEGWLKQLTGVMRNSDAWSDLTSAQKMRRVTGVGTHSDEIDMYRHYKSIGLALGMGLFQGVDEAFQTEDFGLGGLANIGKSAAFGAAAGGLAGEAALGLGGKGGIVRAGTQAVIGSEVAERAGGQDSLKGVAAGVLAGTAGFAVLRGGSSMTNNLMKAKGWQQYSRLGEGFERIRNQVRFSLSPIFDIQRYTEGIVLSAASTFTDRDGIVRQAPITLRPLRTAAKQLHPKLSLPQAKKQLLSDFSNAVAGRHEWADALTAMDARVAEKGIIGFSPFEAMAGTWGQLIDAGVDADDAVRHVKRIYQYGSTARSGLEQSVNFVFFPFSFQKQYTTRLVEFMAEDLGRATMIHNSLKSLEALEETTQFGDFVEDHVKGMRELRKINALAYGLSPGQFGGINRPYIEFLRSTPGTSEGVDSVLNAFLPQGIEIDSEANADEAIRMVERMTPFFRDGKDLIEDISDGLYVATGPAHQSRRADEDAGWEAFQKLKDDFGETAQQLGVSYSTLKRSPTYRAFQTQFAKDERRIREQHPAWGDSRNTANARAAERSASLRELTLAPDPAKPEELAVQRFDQRIKQLETAYGVDANEMPASIQGQLKREAILLAVDEPRFRRLYDRYYLRDLGPIDLEL